MPHKSNFACNTAIVRCKQSIASSLNYSYRDCRYEQILSSWFVGCTIYNRIYNLNSAFLYIQDHLD